MSGDIQPLSTRLLGQLSKLGSLFRALFARVPCYVGDTRWDPNLENYPLVAPLQREAGSCKRVVRMVMYNLPIGSEVVPSWGYLIGS